MNQTQTNPPPTLDEPYLAHPGETIYMSFRIHPDDCQHLNYQLNLTFGTQPPPFQPTTFPPDPNAATEPEWIRDHIAEGNQEATERAEQYWMAQHPKHYLTIPAVLKTSQDGTLEILGTIPDPRNLVLCAGEPPDSGTIYPEIYTLQPFQLNEQFAVSSSAPITLDSQAAQAIANYRIRFDQLYQKRPLPPPPQTEYISNLKIAPPSDAGPNKF